MYLNEIENNSIIICENDIKNKILKELTKEKKLLNIKILTKKELLKKVYFDYDENAIIYLIEKYNYKYEVAKMYLDNLIFIEDKNYKSDKLNHLKNLKQELEQQNLLIKDKNFEKLINNKNIIFYYYDYLDNFDLKTINELKKITNVKIIEKKYNNYNHKVYELRTLEEEVEYTAQKICELVNQGISINNIKLTNIDESYLPKIKLIFEMYELPIEELTKTTIYETKIGQDFIKNYNQNIQNTITYLNETYNEKEIINKIINIINKYIKINDFIKVKELIINDLKNTSIPTTKYKNQIEVINYNTKVEEDTYVFMLNFNQKSTPKQLKDESYITDNIKDELNLNKTIQINKLEKQSAINNIKNIKNLTITYKKYNGKEECYPSNLIEEMNLEVLKETLNDKISYSTKASKIKLAKKLDNYIKYNEVNETLEILANNYEIPYQKYNNNYQKIEKKDLYEYLNNKLNLSYSSMDKYNKCAFSYYVSNILKLDPYETNFAAQIGSIFHYCLELGLKQEIDINETVNNFIKENEYELTNKEKFFIEKIKQEIKFVLETIKEQTKNSNLDKILTEEEVIIEKNKNLNITFKGIIDKMLYNEEGILAIIDYKTGQTDIKLDLVDYGLSMQLPVYLYLAKNSKKLKNPTFAGFYLQQVLNSEIKKDMNKTYEEQKRNNLKLNGYSNQDKNIIKEFDKTYEKSEVINGLKLKKDGQFAKTSKIINNEQIEQLIEKVNQKIDDAIDNIEEANFDINPKIINDKNKSCEFCKYQDICFKKTENNIYINIEKEEEENGLD